jgi:hypothetical protein
MCVVVYIMLLDFVWHRSDRSSVQFCISVVYSDVEFRIHLVQNSPEHFAGIKRFSMRNLFQKTCL